MKLEDLKIVFKLIPFMTKLITLAENVITEPGSGSVKKELVTEGAKTIVDAITGISTGGQAETWNAIHGYVDTMIDSIVGIFNVRNWFK